jgi:HEAT repeat protein
MLAIVAAAALPLFTSPVLAAQRRPAARPPAQAEANPSTPIPAAELDQAFADLSKCKFGESQAPMDTIDQEIRARHGSPEATAALAERLVAVLDGSPTIEARRYVLRRLGRIADNNCIASTSKQLRDPDTAQLAAGVLQGLNNDASRAALRTAIADTKGVVLVQVVNTLGLVGDAPSASAILKLLGSDDEQVRLAAASALGHIGTKEASDAVLAELDKAKDAFRDRLVDAALTCADKLTASDKAAATGIFERFYKDENPTFIRLAALRGLVATKAGESAALVVEAIKSKDHVLATAATGLVRLVPGENAARIFAEALPGLEPSVQLGVLEGIAWREDKSALPLFLSAAKSDNPDVRVVALRAIGSMGGPDQVAMLVSLASTTKGDEQLAARGALERLPGDSVTVKLVELLEKADPATRVELIRALPGRSAPNAVPVLFTAARDASDEVRVEAIKTLGSLAPAADVSKLIAMFKDAKGDKESTALEDAVSAVIRKVPPADRAQYGEQVVAAIKGAAPVVQCALVRVATRIETAASLAAVREAMHGDNADVADAAVRAIAKSTDVAVLPDLLDLGKKATKTSHKILGLQGYITLTVNSDLPAEEKTKNLSTAWGLATRTEEKRQVISGLTDLHSADSLMLLMLALDDTTVVEEAAVAAVNVGRWLKGQPALRTEAMQKVLKVSKNETTRNNAKTVELANQP